MISSKATPQVDVPDDVSIKIRFGEAVAGARSWCRDDTRFCGPSHNSSGPKSFLKEYVLIGVGVPSQSTGIFPELAPPQAKFPDNLKESTYGPLFVVGIHWPIISRKNPVMSVDCNSAGRQLSNGKISYKYSRFTFKRTRCDLLTSLKWIFIESDFY